MFKNIRKEYKGLSEGDLRQLLRILGYDGMAVQNIVFKAKNEPYANIPLPEGIDPANIALTGAQTINMSKQNVKNVMARLIRPADLADALIANLAGALIMDIASKKMDPEKLKNITKTLGKFAAESKALSAQFER